MNCSKGQCDSVRMVPMLKCLLMLEQRYEELIELHERQHSPQAETERRHLDALRERCRRAMPWRG